MKIIQTIISLALVTVFFASCSSHKGDNLSDDSANEEVFDFIGEDVEMPDQKILLLFLDVNYSEGFSQSGAIVDHNGSFHGLPSNFDLKDEDWYFKLESAIDDNKSVRKIDQNDMNIIWGFSNRFNLYASLSSKEYPSAYRDYGTDNLYGIYLDADNNPQYVLLCKFGDAISCLNSDEVINFINWMSEKKYFHTRNFKY